MPALPDAVTALLDAADADALLRDADALAEGLAEAGWAPEVESGRFSADGWDVLSSAWAPSLSVFFDGDAREVRAAALAVAGALGTGDAWEKVDSDGPDWSMWSVDDKRWHAVDEIDGLQWRGHGVVVSLFTAPETPAGGSTLPAHLQLALERDDTPAEGLVRDDARDRRILEDGSVVERWYLVGAPDLPDELLTSLEDDPDPRVRAAALSERTMRRGGIGSV
ncbi:hypothetical protein SAMN04487848_1858 [Microbacterium sp. ru370.1]|uniref:hypothetical protein n=1 Tax=unclassified Microbacterium TaxID=2609290 RepID=UPI000891FD21|nr:MULTISPECIES: hypothetical protein [unclassified Microbacterium]SDO73788.1 hypothetical protein SAMN04487848_1858 [Microbacterium sp. ru370.1]SIT87925.1 hypothetical protein SAMN05880579_1853 [Microbacterium sp. RU1D]